MRRFLFLLPFLCLSALAQVYQSPQMYNSVSNLLSRKPSPGAPFADIDTARYRWVEGSSAATNRYILATPNGAGRWFQLVDNVPDRDITIWQRAVVAGLTNYWAFGDSQTYGATGALHPYTDGSLRMFAVYRYPNILAGRYGLNLTNLAVSGSGISFTATSTASSLGQLNVFGTDWRGIVSGMHGYNDGVQWGDIRSAKDWFKSAQEATLARLFCTNWIDATGITRAGFAQPEWLTTGTVTSDSAAGRAPFPPVTDPTGVRQALLLDATDTLTFECQGDIAIIFERWNQGGKVTVATNGLSHGTASLDTKGKGFFSVAKQLPSAYWLRRLPVGTLVSVTNVSGTNRVLGVVSVGSPSDCANRFVVMGAPLALEDRAIRFPGWIRMIGQSLVSAAQQFPLYNLALADANGRISRDMVPTNDLSHPDVQGQRVIADAFDGASSPSGSSAAATQIEEATIISDSGQFYGNGGPFDFTLPSVRVSFAAGEGYIDSAGASSSVRMPLNIRANLTLVEGALATTGAMTSTNQYPPFDFIALQASGTNAFVSAIDGTTGLPNALNLRGKNVEVSQGPLAVSGSTAVASELPNVPSVILLEAGGIGFVDAMADPQGGVFEQLKLRGSSVEVPQGPLAISGATAVLTNLPAIGSVVIAETGNIGYVDSLSNPQTSTFQPLQLRATRTVVSGGSIQAISTTSTFAGLAPNDSLVMAATSGNGFVDAVNPTGTNWISMLVRSESTSLQAMTDGSISPKTVAVITNTATAGGSGFLLRVNDSNAVFEVRIGAPGSGPGGAGKALYVQ